MTSDTLEPLETLDEKSGKPPESRISNARAVRQRISEMRDGESTRNWRRSKIAGLLDDMPAKSLERLDRAMATIAGVEPEGDFTELIAKRDALLALV